MQGRLTQGPGPAWRYVVAADDVLLGEADGVVEADVMRMNGFVVHPPARGRGVGKQIVTALLGFAREQGAGLLRYATNCPIERNFYLALGFDWLKDQGDALGEGQYVLVKTV